jgi:hypothetical protein
MVMAASLWMVTRWRVTTERPNDRTTEGVVWRRERLAMKGGGGLGGVVVRRALRPLRSCW